MSIERDPIYEIQMTLKVIHTQLDGLRDKLLEHEEAIKNMSDEIEGLDHFINTIAGILENNGMKVDE